MRAGRGRYLLSVFALTAAYVAAGRLGLALDAVSGFATLVWAPSGISLAALLIGGSRLWPGVAAGAFLVNLWAGASLPLAGGIAFGNTLAAVAAAYAIGRIPGFDRSLARSRDALGLIVFGAALSTILSATIGTTSLWLAGVVTTERFGVTWAAWWMGDAIGDLIVAPLLLSCGAIRRIDIARERLGEALVLAVALIGAAVLVFGAPIRAGAAGFVQPYLLSPFLIWAAVRFLQRGATASTFVASVIAIWGTAVGLGPFTDGALHERLGALQAFLAIIAVTFLVLGAVAAERTAAERNLRVARDEAEAASRAKSRFLAVVSHELRTPLNGILGYADLLLSDVAGPINERQNGYVARIRTAAWHLVGIIDGILTFSRGDAHQHDLHTERHDRAPSRRYRSGSSREPHARRAARWQRDGDESRRPRQHVLRQTTGRDPRTSNSAHVGNAPPYGDDFAACHARSTSASRSAVAPARSCACRSAGRERWNSSVASVVSASVRKVSPAAISRDRSKRANPS